MPAFGSETWTFKKLIIKAYDLVISQDLALPSKTITIASHRLAILPGVTISVSGEDANAHSIAANNGRSHGAHGDKGLPGNKGENAGNSFLHFDELVAEQFNLEANGGNGQDHDSRNTGNGSLGGNGQHGGNTGQGRGSGGNSGVVEVYSNQENLDHVIQISTLGSNAGKAGSMANPVTAALVAMGLIVIRYKSKAGCYTLKNKTVRYDHGIAAMEPRGCSWLAVYVWRSIETNSVRPLHH
jgi:hypothetical protein